MATFRRRDDIGSEVWIVFADVLVGFLAIVLMVTWQRLPKPVPRPKPSPPAAALARPTPTPEGRRLIQPPAVERLKKRLEDLQTARATSGYEVSSEGFEVHIVFEEGLLFDKCEWVLHVQGQELLKEVAAIIWQYDS